MILDLINKKRLGEELSYKEIRDFFNGYLDGTVADYQMSAMLMAICINGMTDEETFSLTKVFIDSGDVLDFSDMGITVDKHSTGGVGDKTTMVIVPIVAACGGTVIKMSGRGLGYTGGTIDKLESIPGYKTNLTDSQIIKQVHNIGAVITGQTADLVPMDKVIYSLRDVTSTVSSIPLIASSIMSKKIAGGASKILIDIKVGDGALIENMEDAKALGDLMIRIGEVYNREVRTVISDMNTPLGDAIGNGLEILEAVAVLKGNEKENNFYKLCIKLATEMVSMALNINSKEAEEKVLKSIDDGSAYSKFLDIVTSQKGDLSKVEISDHTYRLLAPKDGTIKKIDALALAKLSLQLGAGKVKISDRIDHSVGVKLKKHIGDVVQKGDTLAIVYYKKKKVDVNLDDIYKIN